MSENVKPRFKLGVKGNTIVSIVCIIILLLLLSGGKGTDTAGMNEYARSYISGNPGSVTLFDVGDHSKVAIIRHEDGSLTGLAFRKVPLLDRWKLTKETVYDDNTDKMSVWISVDDGFNKYIIISDGEKLTTVENNGWYGIYSRMLYDFILFAVITLLLKVGKRVWNRRKKNNAVQSISE